MKRRIALIDCGTNTFHLLIADLWGSELNIIYRTKEVARIGVGGINNNIILPDAVERAFHVLRTFREVIDQYSVKTIQSFATSAFRNAKNGETLKDQINEELDLNLKIIGGEQEAEYIYKGVNYALKSMDETTLVMDIGGGSVEFIIGQKDSILWKKSFEIGGQRLLEKYHYSDPISSDEILQLETYLSEELPDLFTAVDTYQPLVLAGASGTFDTLSDVYCAQKNIEIQDGLPERPFVQSHYAQIHQELITKNRSQRLQIPGMISMRVEMIVVASCLINFILNRYSFQDIRVSTYSLKEGVLSELINSEK